MLGSGDDRRIEQLRRYTRTIPGSADVLAFMSSKNVAAKLSSTAAKGIPPVTAVSTDIVSMLGHKLASNRELAKFVGRVTRAILEDHGYVIDKRNVRVRGDPMFSVASTYRSTKPPAPKSASTSDQDLLFRILRTLRPDELAEVRNYLEKLMKRKT